MLFFAVCSVRSLYSLNRTSVFCGLSRVVILSFMVMYIPVVIVVSDWYHIRDWSLIMGRGGGGRGLQNGSWACEVLPL